MLGIRARIWVIAALAAAALAAGVFSWAPSPQPPLDAATSRPGVHPAVRDARPAGVAERADEERELPAPSRVAEAPRIASRAAPAATAGPTRVPEPPAVSARGVGGTPAPKTPEAVALRGRALERARELGMELPPDVRQALDDLEPLPGEDELAFAERLREAESDALEEAFLTEAALWERYTNESYRLGDPTSHHRAEAREQVSAMTPMQREVLLKWALGKPGLPMPPRFWPASQAAPYDGPDAEPPPADFRWVDPELYYPPSE